MTVFFFKFETKAHAKAYNITSELARMANIRSIYEGVRWKFIVII